MKRFSLFSCFCILWSWSFGQVSADAKVVISNNTVMTISGSLKSNGSLFNNGTLSIDGDSIAIIGTYSGTGELSMSGQNQVLHLKDQVNHLHLKGGNKFVLGPLMVSNLKLDETKILLNEEAINISGSIEGASDQAYVIGQMIRSGSDSLFFPIGSENNYLPLSLTEISGSDSHIGVQLVSQDPKAEAGKGLLQVAKNRYWKITQESGQFTDAMIQLPLSNEDVVDDISLLAIAKGDHVETNFSGLGVSSIRGSLVQGSVKSLKKGSAGLYALGQYFDENLRIKDSLALVNIYESTIGSEWVDKSGWLESKMDNWSGVSTYEKRVNALDLADNNLQLAFPSINEGLEALGELDISNNELIDVKPLLNLNALANLDVSKNRLQFGTLENLNSNASSINYNPQKEVLNEIRVLKETGTEYTVDRTLNGSANSYTWYRNDTRLSHEEGSLNLVIEDFFVDGTYVAHVSNEKFPDLTLTTKPVILRVSSLQRDSASLRALYDAVTTSNSNLSDWTSLPLEQWEEITISDRRVTELYLSDKFLSGDIPIDITDIQGLTIVDLSANEVTGLPNLLGSLPNLTSFDVSDNRLEFDDLENNVARKELIYGSQKPFGQYRTELIPSGSDYLLTASAGGSANDYQWWLTNSGGTRAIEGANATDYLVKDISLHTMGHYVLKVTNAKVPGLTLESEVQQLLASASVEIIGEGIDDKPIEEGVGYALKIIKGKPFDSVAAVHVSEDGIFRFDDLILGDYIIGLEGNDELYVPTYFASTDLWAEADTLFLRTSSAETIVMTPKPGILSPNDGEGRVLGLVEAEFTEESANGRVNARRKVKKAGCSMRRRTRGGGGRTQNDLWELVAYVETNDEGQFEFANIPSGYYRFNIEYPGIPMDPDSFVEFEIGAGGVENNTFILEAYITEAGIEVTKIRELGFSKSYIKNLEVYPVPADDLLNIKYEKLLSNSIDMQIIDLKGQQVYHEHMEKGKTNHMQLDVSRFDSGYYLLQFVDVSRHDQAVVIYKILISH